MKQSLPIVFAFILGLVAVFGVQKYLEKKDREVAKKLQLKEVVVAARNISAGERLTPDSIAGRKLPEKMLPKDIVNKDEFRNVINQPVARNFSKGEPLVWSHLGASSAKKSLSQVIKPGERAITIPASKISAVESYIQPNDRIDIYIAMKVPYKKEKQVPSQTGGVMTIEVEEKKEVTFLLLQNVTVMATGESYNTGVTARGYNSLTLAVTPQEAGLIKFAMNQGTLSMSLRNDKDYSEDSEVALIDIQSFINLAKIKELQNERNKRIEIYRQGKATSSTVKESAL